MGETRGGAAEPCFSVRLPQSRTYLGMSTLRDLIFKRPSRQFQYLHVLLDLSSHEKDKVSLCSVGRGLRRPSSLFPVLKILVSISHGVMLCRSQGARQDLPWCAHDIRGRQVLHFFTHLVFLLRGKARAWGCSQGRTPCDHRQQEQHSRQEPDRADLHCVRLLPCCVLICTVSVSSLAVC